MRHRIASGPVWLMALLVAAALSSQGFAQQKSKPEKSKPAGKAAHPSASIQPNPAAVEQLRKVVQSRLIPIQEAAKRAWEVGVDVLSGNAQHLFSGNSAEILSDIDKPKILSENNPQVLSGNKPEILSGNKAMMLSGNHVSILSGIKVEIHVSDSGNNNSSGIGIGPGPRHAGSIPAEAPRARCGVAAAGTPAHAEAWPSKETDCVEEPRGGFARAGRPCSNSAAYRKRWIARILRPRSRCDRTSRPLAIRPPERNKRTRRSVLRRLNLANQNHCRVRRISARNR